MSTFVGRPNGWTRGGKGAPEIVAAAKKQW